MMSSKELYIKNMVCPRCLMAVKSILQKHNITIAHIELGFVLATDDITDEKRQAINNDLSEIGFELLDDLQQRTVEQIKNTIIEYIRNTTASEHILISEILTRKLNRDYSLLSKLFSATEGITIEQYTILQKVERIKELLSYDQLTLSQIAFDMGYSSVAHISSQFKKVTGMTPSQFRQQHIIHRNPIDKL